MHVDLHVAWKDGFQKPILWYYLPNGHWLLKWSIEQLGNHTVQNLRIIFN